MTNCYIDDCVVATGVCKINSVVIVVNRCYSIGFSTTNNDKNTVFLQTPVASYDVPVVPRVVLVIITIATTVFLVTTIKKYGQWIRSFIVCCWLQ